jgi:hypothetical protein
MICTLIIQHDGHILNRTNNLNPVHTITSCVDAINEQIYTELTVLLVDAKLSRYILSLPGHSTPIFA